MNLRVGQAGVGGQDPLGVDDGHGAAEFVPYVDKIGRRWELDFA